MKGKFKNTSKNSRDSRKLRSRNYLHSNNHKKIFIPGFLLIVFIAVGLSLFYIVNNTSSNNISTIDDVNKETIELPNINTEEINTTNNEIETKKKEPITFKLASIGDIMCNDTQFKDAYEADSDTYDFNYIFDDIKYYTSTADITVGNLETCFGGVELGYSNYPKFNTPDALAYSLKKIGIDVISTASNHSLDMNYSGLSRTINVLDHADISHTGTFTSQESRDTILYKYVKGIKIAFISYTYGTNTIPIPEDKSYCVNLIDKNLILQDINRAKEGGAEFIISCMHWGDEYMLTVNNEQKELANFLFQNGVDVILGNHPHVTQPMEQKTVTLADGTTKDCFVIYSVGNFIGDQRYSHTRSSVILNLSITKNIDDSFSIQKVEYLPIYMYKDTSLSSQKMSLIDINTSIKDYETNPNSTINQNLYNTIKSELKHLQTILGE